MRYDPTPQSIREHRAPGWFNDAKLGIFVHWGLYSVPGWAPTTGPLHDVVASAGWGGWFGRNPYAEWYMNSLGIAGSPTAEYHRQHYGEHFAYEQFAEQFNQGLGSWNAAEWAELFQRAGARYVVLTTKHHDGFLLWPSRTPNPFRRGYHSQRDVVGELTEAVRARTMRMGLYYSGGLDWTFNDRVIADITDLFMGVPQSRAYSEYATGHLRELIERYAPATLWNDIGYPALANLPELFADYYNAVPEGAVNDRFTQGRLPDGPVDPAAIMAEFAKNGPPAPAHFDFRTPEYAVFDEIKQEKWESCRGLGFSFGYNRNETIDNMLSSTELVRSFVDIVSKNGNLLINVGPTGDGTIPAEQRERLLALGDWLGVNGEAIYGTRPWQRAEGRTSTGTPMRFTQKDDAIYAILLDTPAAPRVTIEDLSVADGASIHLLGHDAPLAWQREGDSLTITLPERLPAAPAHALRISQ
ncbi:MAG: alpha-L-fucosidase [Chloroflexales bacterium]|nr:alpha-L-fucosidase [Chloroflexales bacterium]